MMPTTPTRREMLQMSTAAGAAALSNTLPGLAFAQGGPEMLTRPIPQSGEQLPIVGFGTWQTFDVPPGHADMEVRKEVLRILFEAGGKVIDSSPMYGRAEEAVGVLLSQMKPQAKPFLATKVWTQGDAAGLRQMHESMAKLQSPVDLMQVHNLIDWRTHLRSMRALREKKLIRYLGITHYTEAALADLASIIRSERLDFVQFAYSINVRAAEKRMLPLAAERGVAVIINQPFDSGSLFRQVRGKALPEWAAELGCASWSQVFLKFILSHPAVTCVIPGTGNPEHARDNVAAGLGRLPDTAERKRMVVYWDGL